MTDAFVHHVKDYVRDQLGQPHWRRGVGIALTNGYRSMDGRWLRAQPSEAAFDAVVVNVQSPEHVDEARSLLGDDAFGIPIVYDVVGDIYAHYAGAAPPGVRLGDVHAPKPPGWSLGDIFGRGEVEGWSTAAKIALVLGGVTAAYFLYKTVKEVGPPSKKVGEAAGAALVHIGAARRGVRSSPRTSVIDAEFEPSSSRSPRWLTKYEGE